MADLLDHDVALPRRRELRLRQQRRDRARPPHDGRRRPQLLPQEGPPISGRGPIQAAQIRKALWAAATSTTTSRRCIMTSVHISRLGWDAVHAGRAKLGRPSTQADQPAVAYMSLLPAPRHSARCVKTATHVSPNRPCFLFRVCCVAKTASSNPPLNHMSMLPI